MSRNGVQYAKTITKRCPMYEADCAAKVAAHIAGFYPATVRRCDCNGEARAIEAAKRGASPHEISAALECAPGCASRQPGVPFDAAALIEEHCGRYTRGAHKGGLRGWAEIEVAVEGGWKRYGPGERNGRVVYPGTVLAVRVVDFAGKPYLEVRR